MKICYLAPQLTALASTFVYEEIFALEEKGIVITPVSVSRSNDEMEDKGDLLQRTTYLYKNSMVFTALQCCFSFLMTLFYQFRAIKLLVSDVVELKLWNKHSWKLMFQYLVATKLARILVKNECTHLHIHFAHVPTQIGMYAASMANIPFTVMAHANDIFERGLLLSKKAERASKVLTISQFNIEHLKRLGVPAEKLGLVRCGVSFQRKSPNTSSTTRNKVIKIGTLARLVEKKGIDDLISAVKILRDNSQNVNLSIAGDGPLKNQFKSMCEKLKLVEHVSFEGSLQRNQIEDWMSHLDMFVLPCKVDSNGDMDGIPVVLMEAMSQSIPVISTRISGIPELIIDNQTGLLAEPNDSKSLADKIGLLIRSTELSLILSKNARRHIDTEFSQSVNIERLELYFY